MPRQIHDIELPPEVLAELPQGILVTGDHLEALSRHCVEKRLEAVAERKSSGIEETWAACEDAYNGIDDANRGEYHNGKWVKPTSLNAPITTAGSVNGTVGSRSTAFVRLTSRYVDAGAAKISEILLPIDDKAFSFEATPVPVLIKGQADSSQIIDATHGPLTRPVQPGELPPGQIAGGATPAEVPLKTSDVAEEALTTARDKAKKAETRIADWMIECQHHREMRKMIFDAARLGVGVMKGPFPEKRRSIALVGGKLKVEYHVAPADKWVNAWNIYPDPACGENIRNGEYIFEREHYSAKQLRALKGLPGYIDSAIDEVLKAGPKSTTTTEGRDPSEQESKHQYELWYFHGTVPREQFDSANPKAAADMSAEDPSWKQKKDVFAIVTMVNDIVIRAALNPLDSGELPYHNVPWQRRSGYWAGIGVGEQIQIPQRIVNASTRSLLNNAGLSAGPQIVIDQSAITPANKDWTLFPGKIWYKSNDGISDDVKKAFITYEIQNVGDQLHAIIEYGMRLAEESTSIPLITQGQSGKTTPDTLGATQLQNNNANQLLRGIGYTFDDYVTEPMVRMYYEYLLLDPKVPDDEKGDFKINAHGSVAMVERSIQDQTILQMEPMAANPIYGINPKKWAAVMLKTRHLDPTTVQFSKEEQDKIDQQPKPMAPAIEVAKIKAATDQAKLAAEQQRNASEDALARELANLESQTLLETEKLRQSTAQLKVKLDTDRDRAFVETETARAQADYTHAMGKLALEKELAVMKFAADHAITLEQAKTKLADTAMKLKVEKELAHLDTSTTLHQHHTPSADALMKPPAQAPGKAEPGKAFSQV